MRLSFLLFYGALLTSGCAMSAGPGAESRGVGAVVHVVADRDAYDPGDPIYLEVRNGSARDVFLDTCVGGTEGRRRPEDQWSRSYGMGWARCGPFPTEADVWARARRVPAGGALLDSMFVVGTMYEGEWRACVRILAGEGEPHTPEFVCTDAFLVRRRDR